MIRIRPGIAALSLLLCATTVAMAEGTTPAVPGAAPAAPAAAPAFRPVDRSVSTWRAEAGVHLDPTPDAAPLAAGTVPRCIKLNNYWCIKKAGWAGEIAADGEGHVAFASATEGAAVAALLLKRYYVDFNRKTALAIISRWAPAGCGWVGTGARFAGAKGLARSGLAGTLRARWLATHARGFAPPVIAAKAARPHRSIVADRSTPMMPTPSIAVGLNDKGYGETRLTRPITLDALLQNDPAAPRSRSMLGMMPGTTGMGLSSTSCAGDTTRVSAYAAKAGAGIVVGTDGDLGLFDAGGTPTDNLAALMANMAKVEIGPFGVTPGLIRAGIADAFRPGRNPT